MPAAGYANAFVILANAIVISVNAFAILANAIVISVNAFAILVNAFAISVNAFADCTYFKTTNPYKK
ncbi:MAG: hypothetical protein V7L29_14865 [Nostoc sp.]|uniref:hypothetical protein n=1 Tax=Nostoc sp. TaxID=1180 RepID=UPI002FFA9804